MELRGHGVDSLKYMRDDLKQEYRRYRNLYPDLPELQKPFMNVSDILRAYFILADFFTDNTADTQTETMLIGIRDMGLLESALGRQTVGAFGRMKYAQPLEVCATLFFGLVKDHAFADGNKRTALLTLLYQLDCYGYLPQAPQKEFERLVVAVAANAISQKYRKEWRHTKIGDDTDRCVTVIARLLKSMTKRKDNSFHMDVTARDLIHAVENVPNCTCKIIGNKIQMQRRVERNLWLLSPRIEYKTYYIPYHGDTRVIGAAPLRDALNALDIYEQYPDYKSFFSGADPRYMLIQEFEGMLRRLKDK